eukprot:GHRR01012569.1.p1 GENE.GHRR01012569.1~~GHRR01012569.1.p1  ORF type:complete len:424 (+),score=131.85 GHRR01012569.1:550-1821(+)
MRSCATESRLKRLLHILSLWPQVWRPAGCQGGLDPLQMRLYADPELFLLGDTNFATFRLSSCKTTQFGHQGMPGRVLKSGCVQVVQNLRIIPDVLHPRSRLSEPVADHVGEIVYIPVFDTLHPHIGPVAVLEALLSARATDSMLVANFISLAGTVLSSLQLSLSNPLPQPVWRSKLEGRKPRPVHPDSSPDLQEGSAVKVALFAPAATASNPSAAVAAASGAAQCCEQQTGCHALHYAQHQPAGKADVAHAADDRQAAADACNQPAAQHSSSCYPGTPCVSEVHIGHATPTCSTSSEGEAAGTAAVSGQLAGVILVPVAAAIADGTLMSTLSSRPQRAATMLPPAPCSADRKQHREAAQRSSEQQQQPAFNVVSAALSIDNYEAARPCKMRRTLSMCRTKSVPVGLHQVLDAVVASTIPAQSC